MRTEYRIEIRCTPQQLWPFLDEADRQRQWLTTLVDIVPTSKQPPRRWFHVRPPRARRAAHFAVRGADQRLRSAAASGRSFWGGFFRPNMVMQVDYRVAELPSGCRLEYYAEVEPGRAARPRQAGHAHRAGVRVLSTALLHAQPEALAEWRPRTMPREEPLASGSAEPPHRVVVRRIA